MSGPLQPPRSGVKQDDEKMHQVKRLGELSLRRYQFLSSTELARFDTLSLSRNFNAIRSFFGAEPSLYTTCTILSSVKVQHYLMPFKPTEIALVNLAFGMGLTTFYQEFFSMDQLTAVDAHVPRKRLNRIHEQLHPRNGEHAGTGWVIIEDSEFEKTRDILNLLKTLSNEAKLRLKWNVHCIPLGAVCQYLMYLFKEPGLNFDKTIFDYRPVGGVLPRFVCCQHTWLNSKDCAMARANFYGTVLMDKFGNKFKRMLGYTEGE